MNRSVASVILGTFTLRFSTSLTGLLLANYIADLPKHGGSEVGAIEVAVIQISFYLTELGLSPLFGVLCDRIGIRPIMLLGPAFGAVAAVLTGLTTAIPILIGTRFLGVPPRRRRCRPSSASSPSRRRSTRGCAGA